MTDPYTPYETGLRALLEKLGRDHARYDDALVYQQRLTENLQTTRRYGDTETRRAERAEIVDRLNALAREALGVSYSALCQPEEAVEAAPPPPHIDTGGGAYIVGNVTVQGGDFVGRDQTKMGPSSAMESRPPSPEEVGQVSIPADHSPRPTVPTAGEPLALIAAALQARRLLLVWAAVPFPLEERLSESEALLINRWRREAEALPPFPWPVHQLPPLTILSLDPSDRIEAAFRAAGAPLNVLCTQKDVIVPHQHNLIKLAGDLASRSGLLLTWADVQNAPNDPDKAHLLEEARRVARDGVALILADDPLDGFWGLWDELIAACARDAHHHFALGPADACWPQGVKHLSTDVNGLLAGLVDDERIEMLLEQVRERTPAKYDRFSPRFCLEETDSSSEPCPPQSPRRERIRVRFKLQVTGLVGLEFEVRALETPMGEPRATTRLPYHQDALIAIIKALPAPSLEAAKLTPAQAEILRDLDLLTNPSLVSDLHARVGRALYRSLFPDDVGAAFQVAWSQVRAQRGLVSLQLRFDEDAVALARYPWELMYDRRHLLPGGAVELTRYVSYAEAPTPLSVEPPLRLLYVESRSTDLDSLPVGEERKAVRSALEELEAEGLLVLETLTSPTYDALIGRVESAQDHVLHFDGHGTVARRCPACGGMNYPHHTSCQRPGCDRILTDVPPLGYLAFEKAVTRQVDWVDSKALEHLLYPSTVRVAVLSACRSGEVQGETLFGGVGPALIQAGVPVVVTMQAPISALAAARFLQGFYGALARFDSLPAAMTSGRRRLFRAREWFIPALYLRSRDDGGRLFEI